MIPSLGPVTVTVRKALEGALRQLTSAGEIEPKKNEELMLTIRFTGLHLRLHDIAGHSADILGYEATTAS